MKKCSNCKQELPLTSFGIRGGKRGGALQANCKPCDVSSTKAHRVAMRSWVGAYKMERGCLTCDFQAVIPAQLQLDHRDPSTKRSRKNGRAYEPSWSAQGIREELLKCDVVCANCHALKTFTNNDHLL